jgi:hypothetical protein
MVRGEQRLIGMQLEQDARLFVPAVPPIAERYPERRINEDHG